MTKKKEKMNKIKVLIVDIDGTLTSWKNNNEITSKDLSSIKEIQKKGIKVVLATGRILDGAKPVYSKIYQNKNLQYIIHTAGAGCYDMINKKSVFNYVVSNDELNNFINLAKKFKVKFSLHSRSWAVTFANFSKSTKKEFDEKLNSNLVKLNSIEDLPFKTNSISKFIIMDENKDVLFKKTKKIADEMKGFKKVYPGGYATNILMKGIDKSTAIINLLQKMGYSLNETAYVGDSDNDLEAIQSVGLSFATSDSPTALLNEADFIVPDVDNSGLSKAIEIIEKINNEKK